MATYLGEIELIFEAEDDKDATSSLRDWCDYLVDHWNEIRFADSPNHPELDT